MFERLKYLFDKGVLTEAQLSNAVTVKGWITEEEKQTILNG